MPRPELMFVKHLDTAKHALVLAALLGSLLGCTSVTTSAVVTQVRVIDASPNAPGLDIYQGTGVIAYNVGFGSSTSYIPMTPGVYNISADKADSTQQLITAKGTFNAANQYTVLIGDTLASLSETILKDQSQAAPSGQIALRFLDQATAAGGVDLYMVPSGSTLLTTNPLLTNVTFGSNSGYVNLTAGTYTLYAVPTGTVITSTTTTSYTGTALAYSGGAAKTIVLLDQSTVNTATIQVLIASDYDPAGSS